MTSRELALPTEQSWLPLPLPLEQDNALVTASRELVFLLVRKQYSRAYET